MAKFMYLQRGGCEKRPEMTPEQMEAGIKAWMDWVKNGTEAGWLLDPGSPLSGNGAVVQPDSSVIDGPFAESKELVGGYSMVEAPDLAAAIELAKRCPTQLHGSQCRSDRLGHHGPTLLSATSAT